MDWQNGPNGRYIASGLVVALALLIPSMINDAYAEVSISSCGTLNIPGETYVLTADLAAASGTCLTITAGGITLDGNVIYSITDKGMTMLNLFMQKR